MFAGAMLVAMVIDTGLGWPEAIHARIGHPVTWIGALISRLEQAWNRATNTDAHRRTLGLALALVVIGLAAAIGALAQWLMPRGWVGLALTGLLAWPFLALRAMHDHVAAVAEPLGLGDLPAARTAVSKIVGRDPAGLSPAGVARAALESLAENTSDGITAPLFWGLLFGLPGIAAYKAINTLDSMIGHRTARFEAFGWASARIDDLVNLIPARLTGFMFALASGQLHPALSAMQRDARRHRSPNAGWPEASLAGALGVRLSGPRVYADRVASEPWLNGEARDPTAEDITAGLAIYRRTMVVIGLVLAVIAVF